MFKKMSSSLTSTPPAPFRILMLIVDNKEELCQLFTNNLTKKNVNRDFFLRMDCNKLCEVSVVMVGGKLPGGKVMRFVAPGVSHKTRFIAFALNSFKILAWIRLEDVRKKCFSKKVKGQRQLIFEEEPLQKL